MISLTMVVTGRVKHIRKERLLLQSIANQAIEKSREKERLYHEKSMMMAAISQRTPNSYKLSAAAVGGYRGRGIRQTNQQFPRDF
ncbi:MAG: hypothetical protein ACLFSE_06665 [Spirochaetia bacterium]